ncbi:HflX-like GTP-binding protein [Streptomyces sp. NPDC054842]
MNEWLCMCSPSRVKGKPDIAPGNKAFNLWRMHQPRRRDRRPARRVPSEPTRRRAFRLTAMGADVVLVGYFSAKQKDFETLMASAAGELAARGARVGVQMVQRRGVSAGGVQRMGLPYSSRTLLSYGKVREVAQACDQANADAVIFVASLTERQQRTLTGLLGRPAVSLSDILAPD